MPRFAARGRLTPVSLTAFQVGNESFFSELIRAHERRIRTYCRRFAQDRDEEDDLLQATVVHAWEQRATYSARGTIDGWLVRVARKICHQAAAARNRKSQLATLEDIAAPELAGDTVACGTDDNESDELTRVLRGLSQQRLAVALYRLGYGYSVAETAAALGLKPGTVKATLHQALKSLRSHCDAHDD